MATRSIPASSHLPPAFTARERAKVNAYFGRARRLRPALFSAPSLVLPVVGALLVITVATLAAA